MSTSKTAIAKDQEEVKAKLLAFGDDLYQVYLKLHGRTQKQFADTIRYLWDVGHECGQVHRKHARGGVEALSDCLHLSPATVRQAISFAEKYGKDELAELTSMPNISWSHIAALLQVPDEKRKALLQEASDKKLNHRDLASLIQKKLGKRGKGGRPFRPVANISALFSQWSSMSRKWLKQNDSVWSPQGLQTLTTIAADQLTPELVSTVQTLSVDLEELAQRARSDADEAKAVLEDMQQRCQAAATEPAAEATEEPAAAEPAPKKTKSKVKPTKPGKAAKGKGASARSKMLKNRGKRALAAAGSPE